MSKIKIDNIKFDDDDFIIEIKHNKTPIKSVIKTFEDNSSEHDKLNATSLSKAEVEASAILFRANSEAQEKLKKINEEIKNKKEELALKEKELLETAQKQADELLNNAQNESEELRAKSAREGYQEGYDDALGKIQEELFEKLQNFDKFISEQYEIKDKILKSSSKEVLKIIKNICSKILTKELDENCLDRIIKNTVSLFEDKRGIKIFLSEKYAKLLYEVQKKSLDGKEEFNFENFKQYGNFEIVINQNFADDTIIIENDNERYCASLSSQLDAIMRDIYENVGNKPFDIENSENTDEIEQSE